MTTMTAVMCTQEQEAQAAKPQHSPEMKAWLRQREIDKADEAFDEAERYLKTLRDQEASHPTQPAL